MTMVPIKFINIVDPKDPSKPKSIPSYQMRPWHVPWDSGLEEVPKAEAPAAPVERQAATPIDSVEFPENIEAWRQLAWLDRRSLASQITGTQPRNGAEAEAVYETELRRRKAAEFQAV